MAEKDKEKKRVMYIGFKGDRGTPFNAHGIRFEARKVYPVSDEVYRWARFQKGFIVDVTQSNVELDFPKTEFISGANVQI